MPEKRLLQLLIACEQRGGLISHRRLSNGDDAPYEINISWWSAMADGGIDPSYHQLQRFLLTQLLVMMLPGVPAFYLPALLASPNDVSTFRRTGQRRDLNRPRFRAEALNRRLDDPDSDATRVLEVLRKAMAIRASLKPLHPDAGMRVLSEGRSDLVVLERFSGSESVFGVHNMTSTRLNLPLAALGISPEQQTWFDHLQQRPLSPDRLQLQLEPYAVAWLSLS